jgi:hypothetical protein
MKIVISSIIVIVFLGGIFYDIFYEEMILFFKRGNMKYRIVEKKGKFYPQYKKWGFWWSMYHPNCFVITCFFFGEAKQIIELHKKQSKKPIIHNVD